MLRSLWVITGFLYSCGAREHFTVSLESVAVDDTD